MTGDRDKLGTAVLSLLRAAGIALVVAASAGCRSAREVPFDWPERVTEVRGWSYIRLPPLDRCS